MSRTFASNLMKQPPLESKNRVMLDSDNADITPNIQSESANILKRPFINMNRYEISDRLNELAQPRVRSEAIENIRKELLSLSSLIISESSPRLRKLAKPRRTEKHVLKDYQHIPQRVLKAEASPRIIELSKPRNYHLNNPPKKRNGISFFRQSNPMNKKTSQYSNGQLQRKRATTSECPTRQSLRSASDRSIIDIKIKKKQKALMNPKSFQ